MVVKRRFSHHNIDINHALCNKSIRDFSSSFSLPLLELYCRLGILQCHQLRGPTHSQNHYFLGVDLDSYLESTTMIMLFSCGRLFSAFVRGKNTSQLSKLNLSEVSDYRMWRAKVRSAVNLGSVAAIRSLFRKELPALGLRYN